jgi:hypothetical protein
MVKNLFLIRHLGPIPHIWLVWQHITPGPIADQNKNSLQKGLQNSKLRHLNFWSPPWAADAISYVTKNQFSSHFFKCRHFENQK